MSISSFNSVKGSTMKLTLHFTQIVEQSSAVMGIYGETQIPGNGCHREICRFEDSSDPDYKVIVSNIVELCRNACDVPCT